ncbi:MAG: thiamine pyrophosphate-dependent dehydrogenase E1 component subunit alpha [Spirochaetales bacterium]|nr:MAG: thiamine pyrophosphate-dependent dehydrogenase E1 component subunit alpha [Spirochaetales bacterium]
MVRIRYFEENLYQMYLARTIPGMSPHLSVGQEAVAAGVCSVMKRQDYLLTTHRGHGHLLARGAAMDRMLAEILGKETGYCRGRGGSMHIADVKLNILGANGIVGAGLPIAVGAALSSKTLGKDAVTVCFFGDAANNIGTFHESLNMASVFKLPVVWICENNQYGLSTDIRSTLSCSSIAERAASYCMPGIQVDGNDVLAVREAAAGAIDSARQGGGPALIEALTYRWYGHGASDNRSYRTKEEEASWREKCPIERFKKKLFDEKVLAEPQSRAIEEAVRQELDAAMTFAAESAYPDPATVLDNIFEARRK